MRKVSEPWVAQQGRRECGRALVSNFSSRGSGMKASEYSFLDQDGHMRQNSPYNGDSAERKALALVVVVFTVQ